jgi:hypothetical protein
VANETMVVLPQRPWERQVPVAEEQLAGWETDP